MMESMLSSVFPPRLGRVNIREWSPSRNLIVEEGRISWAGNVKFWNGKGWTPLPSRASKNILGQKFSGF